MNEYSAHWTELFLRNFDPAQTVREVAFIGRQLPRDRFTSVLDICCGLGRHAIALVTAGYEVTAVDRDAKLVAEVSRSLPRVTAIVGDMHELRKIPGRFGAALCLWQSFGYFDAATNARIIGDVASLLAPGGRFILDIYHRAFFEKFQGTRQFSRNGKHIVERKQMIGDRLQVELTCDGLKIDSFDWQVFTPEEIESLAASRGLNRQVCCTNFDEKITANDSSPRMQLVFAKP